MYKLFYSAKNQTHSPFPTCVRMTYSVCTLVSCIGGVMVKLVWIVGQIVGSLIMHTLAEVVSICHCAYSVRKKTFFSTAGKNFRVVACHISERKLLE